MKSVASIASKGLRRFMQLVSQKGTPVPHLPRFFCLGRVRRLPDGLIQCHAVLRRRRGNLDRRVSEHRCRQILRRRRISSDLDRLSLFRGIGRTDFVRDILLFHIARGHFDFVEGFRRFRGRFDLGESLLQCLLSFLCCDAFLPARYHSLNFCFFFARPQGSDDSGLSRLFSSVYACWGSFSTKLS